MSEHYWDDLVGWLGADVAYELLGEAAGDLRARVVASGPGGTVTAQAGTLDRAARLVLSAFDRIHDRLCLICGVRLTFLNDGAPTQDCGGDCLACMRDFEEGLDWVAPA